MHSVGGATILGLGDFFHDISVGMVKTFASHATMTCVGEGFSAFHVTKTSTGTGGASQ